MKLKRKDVEKSEYDVWLEWSPKGERPKIRITNIASALVIAAAALQLSGMSGA